MFICISFLHLLYDKAQVQGKRKAEIKVVSCRVPSVNIYLKDKYSVFCFQVNAQGVSSSDLPAPISPRNCIQVLVQFKSVL
jgi:hypothetical protein